MTARTLIPVALAFLELSCGSVSNGTSRKATPSAESELRERLLPQLLTALLGTAAAITLINDKNAVTLTDGALWEGGLVANEDTRFNVASVSKLLTAARIVSLATSGVLSLEVTSRRTLSSKLAVSGLHQTY